MESMVKSEGTGFRPYPEFLVRPHFGDAARKLTPSHQNAGDTPQKVIFPAN